jgi:hypothetical protein
MVRYPIPEVYAFRANRDFFWNDVMVLMTIVWSMMLYSFICHSTKS